MLRGGGWVASSGIHTCGEDAPIAVHFRCCSLDLINRVSLRSGEAGPSIVEWAIEIK
jgi:hypothetical protein